MKAYLDTTKIEKLPHIVIDNENSVIIHIPNSKEGDGEVVTLPNISINLEDAPPSALEFLFGIKSVI